MCTRKNTDFACDWTNLCDFSAIGSHTIIKNGRAEDVVFHILEHLVDFTHSLLIFCNDIGKLSLHIIMDLGKSLIAVHLALYK